MADDTPGSVATPTTDPRGLGSPAVPEAPPSDGAPSPGEVPDYEAMYHEAVEKQKTAENKAKEWEGRSRNVVTRDDLADLSAEFKLFRRDVATLTDPDLRSEDRAATVADLETQAAVSEATREGKKEASVLLSDIRTLLSDAGIDEDDDRLTEVRSVWDEGIAADAVGLPKLHRAYRMTTRVVLDAAMTQATADRTVADRQKKQDALDLDGGGGQGAGAGKTQFTLAEIDAMSTEDYEKHRGHIVK